MHAMFALVCVFLSLNLISPNRKPQEITQSAQCVGEQVNATRMGHGLSVIHAHTHFQYQLTFCTKKARKV